MARVALTDSLSEIRRCTEDRRYDDGAAIARIILDAHPQCVQAQRMLAEALWENGMVAEAQAAFEAVLDSDPEDFVSYAGLGLIAERQGELDQAITGLRRACELAPNSEEVREELIRLYHKAGQADTAKLKISRAALARIYSFGDMPSRALSEFQAVLNDEPDRVDIRLGLAEAYWREGHVLEAKAEAETVLQYVPHSLKAKLILAAALRAEGMEQHAKTFLDQVAGVDPLGEYAQRLFGTESPIAPGDPLIEVPSYLMGAGSSEATTADTDLELPDWLLEPTADEPAGEEPDTQAELPCEPTAAAVSDADEPPAEPEEAETAAAEPAPEPVDAWLDSLPPAASVTRGSARESQAIKADLDAAWAAYQQGGPEAAVAAYSPLVQAEEGLSEVIKALGEIAADTDNLDVTELLGDAYVRAGHHRAALAAYQRVLRQLES